MADDVTVPTDEPYVVASTQADGAQVQHFRPGTATALADETVTPDPVTPTALASIPGDPTGVYIVCQVLGGNVAYSLDGFTIETIYEAGALFALPLANQLGLVRFRADSGSPTVTVTYYK